MKNGHRIPGHRGTVLRALAFSVPLCLGVSVSGFSQCPDGAPPPCRGARVASAPAANTVAVLYFDNRSRDSNDAYLADGLTEAIITKLGDVPRLTVKSRFVVGRYRGGAAPSDAAALARSLGVTYLVTGSVQRAGSRLRVTAEMARASSGDRVWGQQYERGDGDVFAIQEDIARGVATGVAGRLLPAEAAAIAARPTRNVEAYDHLLRGDLLLAPRTQAGTLRALSEYGAAVRLDPRLASGWAKIGLADALRLDWGWGDGSPVPDSVLTNGLAAADRALAIDSLSSDGWMARGYLMMFRNPRDFAGAEEGLRRAVALNPRNAEAWHQLGDLLAAMRAGRPGSDSSGQEIEAAWRRAVAIEPGRPTTMRALASTLPAGPVPLAILDSVIAMDPSSASAWTDRASVLAELGDTAALRVAVLQVERLMDLGARPFAGPALAGLVAQSGDTAGARARMDALLRDLPPGPLHARTGCSAGGVLAGLGDLTRAIALADRLPRGAVSWGQCRMAGWGADLLSIPELRRIWEESRPPWAR